MQLGDDVLEVVLKPNAQIPVTVSGVSTSLSEEATRQRHVLEQIEYDMSQLGPADDYAAAFHCALAVAWPDGTGVVFEGRVEGSLTFPGRGTRGFGYDPIFVPADGELTFGEMEPAAKDAISHRARAFALLKAALLE